MPESQYGTSFGSASILKDGRVVFNVAGNQYRLIAGTPAGEKLELLVTPVEAYERKHYPLDLPDPVAAIRFKMEQRGLTVKDLEPVIGRSNRVYEILNYRRPLTLHMIQRLHSRLGIPSESLIKAAGPDGARDGAAPAVRIRPVWARIQGCAPAP